MGPGNARGAALRAGGFGEMRYCIASGGVMFPADAGGGNSATLDCISGLSWCYSSRLSTTRSITAKRFRNHLLVKA